MIDRCKYKDIFGKPKQGIHSYRIFGMAFVDLFLTFVLAYLIYIYTKYSYLSIFLFLIILSIIIHKLMCVDTTLTKLIF